MCCFLDKIRKFAICTWTRLDQLHSDQKLRIAFGNCKLLVWDSYAHRKLLFALTRVRLWIWPGEVEWLTHMCRCSNVHSVLCMVHSLKISKSRKQFMVSSIPLRNKQKQFDLRYHNSKDDFFSSFFGRIQETINCFRDLLIFN